MLKTRIEDLKKICLKKDESSKPLYAQKVTHCFSVWIVKLIGNSRVSPNQMTFLAIFLGLLSCFFFILANKASFLIAAVLLEAYYIFDAVDGQLARYKKVSSLTGAYFDYIGNHIIHSLVFLAIGYGLYFVSGHIIYFIAAIFSSWGMIFMYLIYDAKYNILFHSRKEPVTIEKETGNAKARQGNSFLKKAFMALHWFCRYPTIMNVITVFAVINYLIVIIKLSSDLFIFRLLIVFYAAALNIVWILKFSKVLLKKELDRSV